jgi:hypothetical protein
MRDEKKTCYIYSISLSSPQLTAIDQSDEFDDENDDENHPCLDDF